MVVRGYVQIYKAGYFTATPTLLFRATISLPSSFTLLDAQINKPTPPLIFSLLHKGPSSYQTASFRSFQCLTRPFSKYLNSQAPSPPHVATKVRKGIPYLSGCVAGQDKLPLKLQTLAVSHHLPRDIHRDTSGTIR